MNSNKRFLGALRMYPLRMQFSFSSVLILLDPSLQVLGSPKNTVLESFNSRAIGLGDLFGHIPLLVVLGADHPHCLRTAKNLITI